MLSIVAQAAASEAPKVVLDLPPGPGNPRNSEGDFIRLKDGRILFVYSHYRGGSGWDNDPAILASRESSDGGRTWSTNSVPVVLSEGAQNVMSVSLLRLGDTIALFYVRKNSDNDGRPMMRISADEGRTWGPENPCVSEKDKAYYVLNNCRVLRMANGRLVLPLCKHRTNGDWDEDGKLVCCISDDAGRSWRMAREEPFATFDAGGKRVLTQEPGLVELKDGRVLMYARTNRGRHWFYYSSDGCETWTKGEPGSLWGPRAPATIKRLANGDLLAVWNDHEGRPELAKAGPAWANGARTPLALGISKDEGRTWPIRRNLAADPNGFYCYYGVLEVDGRLLIGYCAYDTLRHAEVSSVPIDWIYTPNPTATSFDVASFGAKGDGVTKDTAAIQKAIDAAAAAGGGTVELGAGTYLSGSVFLKSNVDFHLGAGAVLKGSPDPADYNPANVCPQNGASPKTGDNTSGGHLVLCIGQHNVTVRGTGKIDGNSAAFLLDEKGGLYPSKAAIPWRPAQMVWFVDSTDVRLEDVEIADAPYWSCFILNCTRVWIRGCYVHTERRRYHTYNGDGIDIDRCRHVAISDCRIDTADDCITLRASCGSRLAKPQDCAFVTVANCSLSSSCNAIRPGVGEGRIHDCVLSNLVISDTRTAFNFVAAYGLTSRGPDITGIRISNVRIVDAREFLKMHHMFSSEALFKDIVFADIGGSVREPSRIWAHPKRPFENVRFERCDIGKGVEVVNADVVFDGGTFTALPLTDKEKSEISEGIKEHKNLLY